MNLNEELGYYAAVEWSYEVCVCASYSEGLFVFIAKGSISIVSKDIL